MSRHAYRMEVERFRFAIATKDVEAALFAGSADMVLWHEEDGGPGYMEAFYTEGDGEEPFSQNAVVHHAGTIAEWWLGERWMVLEARLEGEWIVGKAEEARKEEKRERA